MNSAEVRKMRAVNSGYKCVASDVWDGVVFTSRSDRCFCTGLEELDTERKWIKNKNDDDAPVPRHDEDHQDHEEDSC